MSVIRTAFFGSDVIALPLLETLAGEFSQRIQLVGVWTQPDKARGRGMKLEANGIKTWANAHGIEVHQPDKIGEGDHLWLKERGVDLILVMAYGHILKNDLLAIPRLPVLNFHASLLPKYRGASPINAAIAAGDASSGVSLMQIVRRLDAGAVYGQETVAIAPDDTAVELAEKLALACRPLALRLLPAIIDGTASAVEQEESKVSFTRLLWRDDALLDFNQASIVLTNRVRALHPWPGAAAKLGDLVIKFGSVSSYDRTNLEGKGAVQPGTVIHRCPKEGLIIATGFGDAVAVASMQRPGGKLLPTDAFLRGFPIADGTIFTSIPMRPLSQAEPFPRPSKPIPAVS